MSILNFMPPHIRSAATHYSHFKMKYNIIFDEFLLSSPIFEKIKIKIARKYKSFWHVTKYPQKFLRKTPIWGYRFCRFFSTKKLDEIDEFRIAFTLFADF